MALSIGTENPNGALKCRDYRLITIGINNLIAFRRLAKQVSHDRYMYADGLAAIDRAKAMRRTNKQKRG